MASKSEIVLQSRNITVRILDKLLLEVTSRDGQVLWASSSQHPPAMSLKDGQTIPLHCADKKKLELYSEGSYQGSKLRLWGFDGTDAVMELIFAVDADSDELLLQVEQVGGDDTVRQINHFYRFEKRTAAGGYMILPHGSGYLIPADCPDELPGSFAKGGLIGSRWTLPMFGMVQGSEGLCIIVDTWWDCDVEAHHIPTEQSGLDFNWLSSLGKLSYARRHRIRFAGGMDYVAMAGLYRSQAKHQGLLRTLEEKAQQTPAIRNYIDNVLVRWPAWDPDNAQAVLSDVRKLRQMGFGINFFFPKWFSAGYDSSRTTVNACNGSWQAYLHPDPVPGGWASLVKFADSLRQSDCLIQGFICPRSQRPDSPQYDQERWPIDAQGKQIKDLLLGTHDDLDRNRRVLDNLQTKGLSLDVMYYDGYSAYEPVPEDFSPAHTVSRRENFQTQNACLAETRRRGIIPGAEAARFWCIADCDYFFFTDWSSDRLTNVPTQGAPGPVGEPIPLFQLVFHDCYIAGFSGGGYAIYAPGYDWWPDRRPRLYELMFASAPAYNWLPMPGGDMPIGDWGSDENQARWAWLKRWNGYYRKIACSQMISHQFISEDRKSHRIEFANGVSAELDMREGLCRVRGVSEFSGDWQVPAGDLGSYPIKP